MSSLRNSVKRKAHKERAQPAERRRFGLLEKHKDYVLRARDFHTKEKTLKDLRLKASFRNPDEFYFKMQSTQTRGGVHLQPSSGGGKKWTEDELALMRTQDRGYILTKLQAERKKVEKLQASLHGLLQDETGEGGGAERDRGGEGPSSFALPRHLVFAEDEDGEGKDDPVVADREGVEGPGEGVSSDKRPRPTKKAAAAYRELEMRRQRVQRLSAVLEHMEMQRAVAGKGRKRKAVVESENGETSIVYKWAKQRQR